MTIYCQSVFMTDVRPCTIRGEHVFECDGRELRWSDDTQAWMVTGRECQGCAPRKAARGFVCAACYERVLSGEASYRPWRRALAGVTTAVTRERGGGGAVGYVPMPPLALDMEALEAAYRSYPGSVDAWVGSPQTAEDAIRFGRLMHAAAHAHPIREEPHKLRVTWCPSCRKPAFVWHPPTYPGGSVKVECAACGHVAREDALADISHIESLVTRTGRTVLTADER